MLAAPHQSSSRHAGHSRAHRRAGGTDRSRRVKVNRKRHQLCLAFVSLGNCREKRPSPCQVVLKSSQDILGRLSSVTEDATPSDGADDPQTDTGYAYDLLGRKRVQLTFAPGDTVSNSVETSYLYDSLGRLDVMTDTDSGGNTLASYDYTVRPDGKRTNSDETFWFDADGNGQQDASEIKTSTYAWSYDDAGRLTDEVIDHWDGAFDQSESFTYDLTGNRVALDRDRGNDGTIDEAITYAYDANDRLLDEVLDSIVDTDDTTTTYAYDQTQQTSKTVTRTTDQLPVSAQQFTYNLQGRMASVTNETFDATGTLTARDQTGYEYDSKSYRVKLTAKSDPALDGNFTLSSTTEFLASHRSKTGYAQTLRETKFDDNGNVVKQIDYTFGDDEIAQRVREFDASGAITSEQTLVFGHDGHGSVRLLYDLAGTATKLIQAFTFSAYGQMIALHNAAAQSIAVSGRLSSTGYSGETFDAASQLQYLRARFYNPANGRFNRLDPFTGNNRDPQSLHKYAYVHGDPIGAVDPSGLFALVSILGAISISSSGRAQERTKVRIGVDIGLGFLISGLSAVNAGKIYKAFGLSQMEGNIVGFKLGMGFYIAYKKGASAVPDAISKGLTNVVTKIAGLASESVIDELMEALANKPFDWNNPNYGRIFSKLLTAFANGVFSGATGTKTGALANVIDAGISGVIKDWWNGDLTESVFTGEGFADAAESFFSNSYTIFISTLASEANSAAGGGPISEKAVAASFSFLFEAIFDIFDFRDPKDQ